MKNVVAVLMLSTFLSTPVFAADIVYGDTNQNIATLEEGDTIGIYSGDGTTTGVITLMKSGDITEMTESSKIITIDEGWTGHIGTMKDNSRIDNIKNWVIIDNVTGNAHIENMDSGGIGTIDGDATIETMAAGSIDTVTGSSILNTVKNGAYIDKMTGGTINSFTSDTGAPNAASMTNFSGGKIVEMSGEASIVNLKGTAEIETMEGDTKVGYMTENSKIGTVKGNAVVGEFYGGEINSLEGNSEVPLLSWGKINTVTGNATVVEMKNGEIGSVDGSGASVGTVGGGDSATISKVINGATIGTLTDKGSIIEISSGSKLNSMTGGYVETITGTGTTVGPVSGGIIGTVTDNATVKSVSGDGFISELSGGAKVTDGMTGGSISTVSGAGTSVGPVSGGTIQEVTDQASVGQLSGTGKINNVTGGASVAGMSSANNYIGEVRGDGSTVGTVSAGEITFLFDNATVNTLSGTAHINTVNNSKVNSMTGGSIASVYGTDSVVGPVSGGIISQIGGGASIGQVSGTGKLGLVSGGSTVAGMSSANSSIDVLIGEGSSIGTVSAGNIGTVTDQASVDTLSGSGKIGTLSDGSILNTMSGGSIGTVSGTNTKIETFSSGNITKVTNNAEIVTMSGGTITTFEDNSKIDSMTGGSVTQMHSGSIGDMSGNSYVGLLSGGSIKSLNDTAHVNAFNSSSAPLTDMNDNSYIGSLNGGAITNMNDNARITTVNSGTITNMNDNSSITTFGYSGKIVNMNNGTIGTMNYGTIENMYNGTITKITQGKINNMSGGTISNMRTNGGVVEIGEISGTANITAITGDWAGAQTGGVSIAKMSGGSIGDINFNWVNGSSVYIGEMIGGTIGTITNLSKDNDISFYIGLIDGGEITSLGGWKTNDAAGERSSIVAEMKSGKISTLTDAALVADFSGGEIANMTEGGTIGIMSGAAAIGSMTNYSEVKNFTNGTIGSMDVYASVVNMSGGTITKMAGQSKVMNLSSGTIELMDEESLITHMDNDQMVKGSVMSGGTIKEMIDKSYVNADMIGGTIEIMRDNAKLYHLAGGTVEDMNDDSTIEKMSAGFVGNISSGSSVGPISGGTIYGNVANGQAFTIENNGSVRFVAENVGNTLDRVVNAGDDAQVYVKDYTTGANSGFNMGTGSTLILNGDTYDIPTVSFTANGKLVLTEANGVFTNATIQNFSAGGQVTFDMFVDEALGGSNDMLTIVSNTGTVNDHLIAVGSHHSSTSNRSPINLIMDETGTMSFELAHGKYVGLGSKNYSLFSTTSGAGNQWSLGLFGTLSDASLGIGSVASANLISLNTIQASLHQRMGDIRSQRKEGAWARTYANHTNFKDLSSTEVNMSSVEGGFDKVVANFAGGKFALGVGLGINYSDIDVKAFNSKDGGARTTMPYMGVYGTWSNCDGLYIDAVAKYAYNDTNGYYYDGANAKQNFNVNTHAVSLSLEAGYQYWLGGRYTLEPRAQLSYTIMKGDHFLDDAGYRGKYGDTNSLLGTIGVIGRYDIKYYQYYAKASIMQEFAGDTDITYDNTKFSSDIGGTRGELGLGYMVALKNNINLYAEAVYQVGTNSYSSVNGNLGLYWKF